MTNSLPFATSPPRAITGALKERPEDFVVEEIPAYAPAGAGEHLYVHFEKTGLDTKEAVKRIARALEVEPRDAGFAGQKDRHAVTRQWASFHRGDATKLESASIDGVRVLAASLHGNKLRTGHLHGNRFRIRLRRPPGDAGVSADADEARRILGELARIGVPNFYGDQRFGREGDNAARARAWIVEGGKAPRDPYERKWLVSAWQSQLFNVLCSERVLEGTHGDVIDGDLCRKEETGGMFVSTDLAADRERAASFEISATGPMFGSEMKRPAGEAARREDAALAAAGIDHAGLARFARSGEGARRPYRVRLGASSVESDDEGIVFSFELPPGAYATIVLRELTRS